MPSALRETYQRLLAPPLALPVPGFCGHWLLAADTCILLWPAAILPTEG